ncbi:MAG TPA: 4-hydroxyphenylacetate 3-hydroxylase N-terminal domain-containing protein [Acetobacteraceae bacterium]|nr:4-hydroxyphenylacetate 3-hydroxylase N-terminal domain-containing protein [Acetobacteraceae bacterium]
MSSTNLRTGEQYLTSIRNDGREVVYDGEIVRDVTAHPAFQGAARSYARLWDIAADPLNRDLMTFPSPRTGNPVLRCYQIPKELDDLRLKRRMTLRWAEETFGLMGRTVDFGAELFTGFAAKSDVFANGGKAYADNLTAFHEYARDSHLHIAYAIVPPPIDKSRPCHQQSDPTLYAGVVAERDGGIILKGAQQLATGAVFADYLFLSCITPLGPGDENHAISVALPVNTPGLRLHARRSYATNATSLFDYPLSSRFDETDALVILENAFVPWERVFIYRDRELCRQQWIRTPAHVYANRQAQIRYSTKLRFLLGVMKHHCEITGTDSLPASQAQLGEMAALASIVDMMIDAQETRATIENGVVWPSRVALFAIMAMQSDLNPRLMDLARELSGGAMIMVPSSRLDYENPEIARALVRYVASPNYPSRRRVALTKLAWDLIGSEFAGRHQQYEKFYAGPAIVNKLHIYRNYDFADAKLFAEAALMK